MKCKFASASDDPGEDIAIQHIQISPLILTFADEKSTTGEINVLHCTKRAAQSTGTALMAVSISQIIRTTSREVFAVINMATWPHVTSQKTIIFLVPPRELQVSRDHMNSIKVRKTKVTFFPFRFFFIS
jgi:hypothetical protein